MDITLILVFLLLGLITGYFEPFPDFFYRFSSYITELGLIILLTSMGARIGVDQKIINQLSVIGFKSFILALFSIIGSVFFLKIFTKFIKSSYTQDIKEENIDETSSEH